MKVDGGSCGACWHEAQWINDIVPILEQFARWTRGPEAFRNPAGRNQIASGRHFHPRAGQKRRGRFSPCRHAALRNPWTRAKGPPFSFAWQTKDHTMIASLTDGVFASNSVVVLSFTGI